MRDNIRSDWQAHQEIISGLSSVSIRQSHQRKAVPRTPQKPLTGKAPSGPLKRACLSLVQTGLLLVGCAFIGALLAA